MSLSGKIKELYIEGKYMENKKPLKLGKFIIEKEEVKDFIKELKEEDYYKLAVWLHDTYEEISKKENWETQKKCKVEFEQLPKENKKVMLDLAVKIIERNIEKINKLAGGKLK